MATNKTGAVNLPRIVVHVDGGTVQAVYASDPTTQVEVVDYTTCRRKATTTANVKLLSPMPSPGLFK